MQRRHVLLLVPAALAAPARAHHGWSSFDQDRPIYIEGRVTQSRWRNPHAELVVEIPAGFSLPADLARRPLPQQSASVDGKALMAKATAPRRPERSWEVELAPLTRLQTWNVSEIRPGATVGVLGFTLKDEKSPALIRAEYLFVEGKAYGLRSSPA